MQPPTFTSEGLLYSLRLCRKHSYKRSGHKTYLLVSSTQNVLVSIFYTNVFVNIFYTNVVLTGFAALLPKVLFCHTFLKKCIYNNVHCCFKT